MSWRTVVISNRCKLDLKLGYMVIRGEETRRIFLDEVALVLIENPAVSLTGCLLEALTDRKIRVIFCGIFQCRFPGWRDRLFFLGIICLPLFQNTLK